MCVFQCFRNPEVDLPSDACFWKSRPRSSLLRPYPPHSVIFLLLATVSFYFSDASITSTECWITIFPWDPWRVDVMAAHGKRVLSFLGLFLTGNSKYPRLLLLINKCNVSRPTSETTAVDEKQLQMNCFLDRPLSMEKKRQYTVDSR